MRISDWSSDLCSSDLQVGEHRKQHETAHERDGVVEAQRLQPRIARLGPGDAAMAIDARRSDIFGLAEQFLAAIGANDVAEDSPEIADIGILRNLDRSEEHTSELQSLMRISYAVFCLKKKKHPSQDPTKQRSIPSSTNE